LQDVVCVERDRDGQPTEQTLLQQRSDESEQAEDWPSNPPLQQLDQCQLAGQRRGLVGLGMAGGSHWSLAVEATQETLEFEVACRLHAAPRWLGSRYDFAAGATLANAPTDQSLALAVGTGAGRRAILLSVDPELTQLEWDPSRRRIDLCPRGTSNHWPATLRWRYVLRLTP
jgi:hypothetical protein